MPLYDDQKLFEFMVLDAFQAGLSWRTVLHKRKNFEKAFSNFDVKKISHYGEVQLKRLMADAGIIRNSQKIAATIENAKQFLKIQKEFGSFYKYIWQFVDHETQHGGYTKSPEIPAKSHASDNMSQGLKARGFKFVGSTICYAFMQAAGMMNDHTIDCFRYKELIEYKRPRSPKL